MKDTDLHCLCSLPLFVSGNALQRLCAHVDGEKRGVSSLQGSPVAVVFWNSTELFRSCSVVRLQHCLWFCVKRKSFAKSRNMSDFADAL